MDDGHPTRINPSHQTHQNPITQVLPSATRAPPPSGRSGSRRPTTVDKPSAPPPDPILPHALLKGSQARLNIVQPRVLFHQRSLQGADPFMICGTFLIRAHFVRDRFLEAALILPRRHRLHTRANFVSQSTMRDCSRVTSTLRVDSASLQLFHSTHDHNAKDKALSYEFCTGFQRSLLRQRRCDSIGPWAHKISDKNTHKRAHELP